MSHTIRLKISGMTCGGCASAVRRALTSISGVDEVQVDLQTALAEIIVGDENLTLEQLVTAIRLAGYNAQPIS